MFKFLKKQENTKEIGYEERERKTPFLGYVLLIAMAISTLWLGLAALDDLDDVPKKPEKLSSCAYPYIEYRWEDQWHNGMRDYRYDPVYEYSYSSGECDFSELEKQYGADEVFNKSKGVRGELSDLRRELSNKESELSNLRYNYELGLTEEIAGRKPGIYDAETISPDLKKLESEVSLLRTAVNDKEKEFEPFKKQIEEVYVSVVDDLRSQWRWHDFYSFLLQGIFVLPLFFFLLKSYFQLSAKNSPYLIIVTFLLIPVSIFVLKIVFVYFWGLFLAKILEVIWSFIKEFQILKSLISYFGMILAAVVFGGAVYFLQKKIFDPKRVAKRHLRDKKCPNCSFSLDLTKNFCSNCGHKMMEKCQKCDKNRYADLAVCHHCGDKRDV